VIIARRLGISLINAINYMDILTGLQIEVEVVTMQDPVERLIVLGLRMSSKQLHQNHSHHSYQV